MKKIKIFISSVQKEFAEERRELYDYLTTDSLLGRFFDVFLFEHIPAVDNNAENVYLDEVKKCDIYLGILGQKYGFEDNEGISPTEREFNKATELRKVRLIFIKKTETRDLKEQKFIDKVQNVLVRKSFSGIDELKVSVYSSLVDYLLKKEIIRTTPFDATYSNAQLNDIDSEKIKNFIRLAKEKRGFPLQETDDIKTVLTHLNLFENDKIKNAAILLFGKNPQKFFITSEVRCAYFHGNTTQKPIPSYKVFKGDVFELVDQAVEFVLSKLDYGIETRSESVQIPGEYEIPKEIIAEAIVNAIAHRDYTSNASVQVMVFRNRIEIWNPGTLPLGWTTEKLKQLHNSVPANPLLAEPMYLNGYIERLGTGTTDIVEKAKEAGLKEPEFVQDDIFRTIVYRKENVEVKQPELQPELRPELQPESNLAMKVLFTLRDTEMGKSQISKKLGQKSISGELNKQVRRLLQLGFIEQTIPEKPNSKLQKYRLTEKGKKIVDK